MTDNPGAVSLTEISKSQTGILKGFAILLVMLGHIKYIVWGGAGGVTLFLLLSGYGVNTSCMSSGLNQYWQKRFRNVWFPYFFVGVLDILFFHLSHPLEIICTLTGLDFSLNADKTMWYISFILFWYLMYYCLFVCARFIQYDTSRVAFLILGLFISSFLAYFLYKIGVWHNYSGAQYYIFAFPLGVLLSQFKKHRISPKKYNSIWLLVLLLSISYIIFVYPKMYDMPMAFAMAFLLIALIKLIDNFRIRFLSIFSLIGSYSYPLYLFEGIVLNERMKWFAIMKYQILIDSSFLIVSGILAYVYWQLYLRFEKHFLFAQ